MAGIAEMTGDLILEIPQISEDAQKLFQTERVVIGKCRAAGKAVYEGKRTITAETEACQFVMWKNDRFLRNGARTFTPKIAAALLKDGKAKVKGLRSFGAEYRRQYCKLPLGYYITRTGAKLKQQA